MSWTWANPAMLLGLASLAIPLAIHFLNRRRNVVVDWGAMQFLEAGSRSRQRVRLTDALLMAARMLVLGLVVLGLARPALGPGKTGATAAGAGGGFDQAPRDVVLVIDGSASMGRRGEKSVTAFDQAREWSKRFVERLLPGSAVSVILGRERAIRVVEPLSRDRRRVLEAIEGLPAPAGSSDLATAAAEALELLEQGEQGRRDVVVLSDGQALPWRKDEGGRWELLRALYQAQGERTGVEPRMWALGFDPGTARAGADGAVGAIELPRGLVPPGLTLEVKAAVRNGGPDELLRRAELFVDGQASGEAQAVGPLPAGSATTVAFRVKLEEPGSRLLSIRLDEGSEEVDPLPANDRAERPVEVTAAVPVLLVDGDRGLEPLSSETDFLRAALAPTQDDAPRVLARVIDPSELDVAAITNQKVLVLANVGRLSASGLEAVSRMLDGGGGVLVAPGDRVEAKAVNEAWSREGSAWLPASIGEWRGDLRARESVAHPAPSSFGQSILGAFGQGQDPALGQASLFGYWVLTPVERAPGAVVLARLDTGDPWLVERAYRKGRVMLLAGPLDAEGGTLPVNPDFVPLVHELIYALGDPAATGREGRPGEPLSVELDPALVENLETLAVTTPGGATVQAAIERTAGRAFARLAAADEPGTYRFAIPGGPASYATVRTDEREWDSETLSASDRQRLEEGWELSFVENGQELERAMSAAGSAGRSRPLWRWLVLAGLGGLCLEIFLTRRIVLSRGVAERDAGEGG